MASPSTSDVCLIPRITIEDSKARLRFNNSIPRLIPQPVSDLCLRDILLSPAYGQYATETQPRTTASLSTMPILPLQTLNQLHILLLRLLGFDSLIVDFLPGAAFGFLLWSNKRSRLAIPRNRLQGLDTGNRRARLRCGEISPTHWEGRDGSSGAVGLTLSSNMPGALDSEIGGSWLPSLKRP